MPNSFFGLNIGKTGLIAASVALNTTSHNASNANTDGYSRQVITQTAQTPISMNMSYGMVGTGTVVTEITQVRSEYYDNKYWDNSCKVGYYETINYEMLKIEDYFNEMDSEGFTTEFNNFFKALSSLNDNVTGTAERSNMIGYATNLIEYFETIKSELLDQQEDINAEVSDTVDKINTLAADIAALNQQINTVELTGESANDLRDKRALLIDELSSIVDISVSEQTYENSKTSFRVYIGTDVLVDDYTTYELQLTSRTDKTNDTDATGLYDITWSYGDAFDPVGDNINGSLKALLEVRDGNNQSGSDNTNYKGIPYYIEQINEFLETFTTEFNSLLDQGYNLNNETTADMAATYGETDFFLVDSNGSYYVNEIYTNDPDLLCLSDSEIQDGVENAGIVQKLIDLKDAKMFDSGTPQDKVSKIIVEIAIDTARSTTMSAHYTNLEKTITNNRLSVMGVDSDEEAMNLVKYQEAYDLAAKVIQVMSEIYDTLINGLGV